MSRLNGVDLEIIPIDRVTNEVFKRDGQWVFAETHFDGKLPIICGADKDLICGVRYYLRGQILLDLQCY